MQRLTAPLRICGVCGLEAHSEQDLELFKKRKRDPYGRRTICKKCVKEQRCRTAEFIEVFRARGFSELIWCHFCGEEVTKLEGKTKDSLNIHSLDGNHENWNPVNKVPAHSGCHRSWHNIGEKNYQSGRTGERSGSWKGDDASDHAKYMREWRRKRKLARQEKERLDNLDA